ETVGTQLLLHFEIARNRRWLVASIPEHGARASSRHRSAQTVERRPAQQRKLRAARTQFRIQRRQRAVQPPARRAAGRKFLLLGVAQDVNGNDRAAMRGGGLQRRVVAQAQVLAQPDDGSRALSLTHEAHAIIRARYHSPMPSFDIVSELNPHEVANAIDQANREVSTRFDFKGTNAKFELTDLVVTLSAPADFQLKQMMDILKLKLTKRGIDIVCMKVDEPVVTGQTAKQVATLRQGVDTELGKKIQRLIKDSKLKVQAAIQDKQVRVTGKSRDDLQSVIALIRGSKLELQLQFTNFRD